MEKQEQWKWLQNQPTEGTRHTLFIKVFSNRMRNCLDKTLMYWGASAFQGVWCILIKWSIDYIVESDQLEEFRSYLPVG